MRLVTWKRLGIIASVIWVVIGPTYFHLSQGDNARRIAGDRYQLCIKQNWATKGGCGALQQRPPAGSCHCLLEWLGSARIYSGGIGVVYRVGSAFPGEKSKEQATSRQASTSICVRG